MAHPLPRIFSRRIYQQSSPSARASNLFTRRFQVNSAPRRSYATGESGPNPRPGQNPFKIWPFVAITVAGSGAYILMVRSRTGTRNGFFCNCLSSPFQARIRELFSQTTFQATLLNILSLPTQIILQKKLF
jgi:hypothetical protein